jgi:poly(beta-D-mannuronate) lyase
MNRLLQKLSLLILLSAATPGVSGGMTPTERSQLDLSRFQVQDTSASYFDVARRQSFLATTSDPLLRDQMVELSQAISCRQLQAMPIITGNISTPQYYDDRAGWAKVSAVFHAFEDAVSDLAATYLATDDDYYGKCLIKLLDHWSDGGAFLRFDVDRHGLQTWFQIEGSLLASTLAYSIVRDRISGMELEKQRIEDWLLAATKMHMSYAGGINGSCCNNHFYRRALNASMLGVITGTDELFQLGVSAVYSALADADQDGALPLEMSRGRHASQYQNYATMYLVLITQVAMRQGFDLYQVSYQGRQLSDIVDFTLAQFKDLSPVREKSGSDYQNDSFMGKPMYLAWLEVLKGQPYQGPDIDPLLAKAQPGYNRVLGGHLTLYFFTP